jgi:uncharacterized membrane protein
LGTFVFGNLRWAPQCPVMICMSWKKTLRSARVPIVPQSTSQRIQWFVGGSLSGARQVSTPAPLYKVVSA